MKKYLNLAFVSAVALAGTCSFTACSDSEEVLEQQVTEQKEVKAADNPTYDPVNKTVTAQFVLNVSSAETGTTRQSSDIVQKNANFRGMKDAKLIGLSTTHSSYLAPYNGESTTSTDYKVKKTYDLGTLYASSSVNNEGTNNRDNSSRRVLQLSLPLQTDAMLVYARAIPSGTDDEVNGKVTMNVTANPENTTFDLNSRLGNKGTEYERTLNMAAAIVNRVMSCSIDAAATYTHEVNNTTNEAELPAISWRGLGTSADPLVALEEIMAKAYQSLTTLGTGEYRAGNAKSIRKTMYDLHQTMTRVYNATATGDRELNAQRLAYSIKVRIEKYFTGLTAENTTTFHAIGTVSEVGTIAGSLKEGGIVSDQTDFDSKFSTVSDNDLRGFPGYFGLPEGAAQLAVSGEGVFSYKTTNNSLLGSGTMAASNYMYPSELLYFDNSALRVNDAEKQANDYPNGYNTWNTNEWTGWTTGPVVSSTRSVAVKNNINYGVAMLKSTVSLNGTSFQDNRKALVPDEENQVLDDTDVGKFTLTGILVGGQIKQLGWDYLAKTPATADNWNYVIYDNQIPNDGKIPTTSGKENYTLVFDNYNSTIGTQSDVYVALEFVNNSEKTFYGKGNIVPVGGTFYLVAKLALGSNTITAWDANYAIPPYNDSGASKQITRIFVQDFMTSVNFKIGNTSLQNAFVTMPDLRSTQTSLGLSVDLNWQTGLSFETTLGE